MSAINATGNAGGGSLSPRQHPNQQNAREKEKPSDTERRIAATQSVARADIESHLGRHIDFKA